MGIEALDLWRLEGFHRIVDEIIVRQVLADRPVRQGTKIRDELLRLLSSYLGLGCRHSWMPSPSRHFRNHSFACIRSALE